MKEQKKRKKGIILPIFLIFGFIAYARKKEKTNNNNINQNSMLGEIVNNQKIRKCDQKGCGYFGAKRGEKKHRGVDIITTPEELVYAPISGSVRKLIVYPNQNEMIGVEISNEQYKVKLFYVNSNFKTHDFIQKGEYLGKAQNIAKYWNAEGKMTNHVHIEVREKGKLIDPTNLLNL